MRCSMWVDCWSSYRSPSGCGPGCKADRQRPGDSDHRALPVCFGARITHSEQRIAPVRRNQTCHRADSAAHHDHLQVCPLDATEAPKSEGDDSHACQCDDKDPAYGRLRRIDGAAPREQSCEREKSQACQPPPLDQCVCSGTRSRKRNSPPLRSSKPATSRSRITAMRPSRGSKINACSARWVREPSVAGYSSSGSWKNVCSWTDAQPRSAYSTIMRPEWMLPVPDNSLNPGLAPGVRKSRTRRFRSLSSAPPYATPFSTSNSRLNTTSASALLAA